MQQYQTYQLKITNFETRSDVVYYQIQVLNTQTKVSWSFQERYKNMYNLHGALSSELKQQLPSFPAKKLFGNTDPEFISTRKAGLQNYFKTLLQMVDVDACQTLKKFLTQGDQKQIKDQTQSFKEESIKPIEQQVNQQQKQQIQQQKQQENERYKKEIKDKLASAARQIQSKFVDLGNIVNSPDELDIKRKRAIYDQVKIDPKTVQIAIDLPKPSANSKLLIAQPTVEQNQPGLINILQRLQTGIENIIGH